jgi:molybdate transport system ATP-binding protein
MPRPLIELERVNVHLDGRHVLHDVSWTLRPGQQWAIVGPNGSGKSTLLGVIRGDRWIDPDGGVRRYALDGAEQPVAAAAPRIGYVSPELQERYTRLDLSFSGRVLIATGLHDSVYLPRGLDPSERERVDALVDRFGLNAIAARPVRELSFGELRVLLVARALVRAPRVLVLDEFTNGLDRRMRRELLAFLARVAGTTHVVCASHRTGDLPETTNAHAVLAGGRIAVLGDGPPRSARLRAGPERRPAAAPVDDEPLVAIRGADVYRGENLVLRGIDWSLRRGEHTVIRGENGSGKSTFAELIAGTVHAAYGADVVRFGERGPFDLWELKRRIAHVSDELQTAYDVNPTAEDVVCSGYASSIGIMLAPDASRRADAVELMRRLGLDHLRARRFLMLSFGERRKVLIARGLVNRPEVLILDEIWSGLDEQFRETLRAILTDLAAGGTTVIVISHHDDDLPAFVRRECVVAGNRITTAAFRAAP